MVEKLRFGHIEDGFLNNQRPQNESSTLSSVKPKDIDLKPKIEILVSKDQVESVPLVETIEATAKTDKTLSFSCNAPMCGYQGKQYAHWKTHARIKKHLSYGCKQTDGVSVTLIPGEFLPVSTNKQKSSTPMYVAISNREDDLRNVLLFVSPFFTIHLFLLYFPTVVDEYDARALFNIQSSLLFASCALGSVLLYVNTLVNNNYLSHSRLENGSLTTLVLIPVGVTIMPFIIQDSIFVLIAVTLIQIHFYYSCRSHSEYIAYIRFRTAPRTHRFATAMFLISSLSSIFAVLLKIIEP